MRPVSRALLLSSALSVLAQSSMALGQAQDGAQIQAQKEAPAPVPAPPPSGDKPVPPPPQDGVKELSLEQAIAMGQQNAIAVARAGLTKEATGAQLMQAYAEFLPNLGVNANGNYNIGKQYFWTQVPTLTQGRDWGTALTLSSSINLFNGFADQAALRAALNRDSGSNWTFERAREQIGIDITQAYLQTILDEELVGIAKKNFEVSGGRQTLLEEQARIGAKDLATLYQQQAQTSADESAVTVAVNKWKTDGILLTRRLRLDPGTRLRLVQPDLKRPPTPYAQQTPEELVKIALSERKDLKAYYANSTAADQAVDVARGGYYPRFDFGVTAGTLSHELQSHTVNGVDEMPLIQQDPTSTQLKDHWLYTLGLTMTWSIFDRGIVHNQVEQAAVQAKSAALDKEDLQLQVEGEVRQSLFDLQSATLRYTSTGKGLVAAQQGFESMNGRYGVGAASFLDLTTAQSLLAQAEASRAQAQIDVYLQSRLVEYYLGEAH